MGWERSCPRNGSAAEADAAAIEAAKDLMHGHPCERRNARAWSAASTRSAADCNQSVLKTIRQGFAYFSSSTTGPETGSVSPSSVSRNVSSVASMNGRASARLSMSSHSPMMQ